MSERFLPFYDQPISTKPPTKIDLQIDATLSAYMDVTSFNGIVESGKNVQRLGH